VTDHAETEGAVQRAFRSPPANFCRAGAK
jgi:hypothetical protein